MQPSRRPHADGFSAAHAAKGGPSLRATCKLSAPAPAPAPASARRRSPRRVLIATLTLAAILVAGAAYAARLHAEAARSTYVQQHGVPATGLVRSVQNSGYRPRSWHDDTAWIGVRLSAPVAGDEQSTVLSPDTSALTDAEPVRVLVDPRHPGYAELPGHPYFSNDPWIFVAALVAFCAVLGLLTGTAGTIDMIRRRRGRPPGGNRQPRESR